MRLGALCGPSNGLTRFWDAVLTLERPRSGDDLTGALPLRRNYAARECGRFVVAFDRRESDRPITLQIVGAGEPPLECRLSQSGFCPPKALVCDPQELRSSLGKRGAEGQSGDHLATLPDELFEVNIEWWALPSPPPPMHSGSSASPLPSVE